MWSIETSGAGLGAMLVGTAALVTAGYGVFAPRSSLFCPVITRAGPGAPCLALTFDDGPLPGVTDLILDRLDRAGARATFFVVGSSARRYPELVRRMLDEGHEVANHTVDHRYSLCFRWWQAWEQELRRADDLIERAIGRRPRFFRPPMGYKTPHLAAAIRRTGHRVVAWSRRALDGAPTTAARIVARLEHAGPGEILALHDGVAPLTRRTPRATVDALPPLLDHLTARALRCVTLSTLLGEPAYAPAAHAP